MPTPAPIAVLLNPAAGTASGQPRIAAELAELFRALGRDAEIVALAHGQDPLEAAKRASTQSTIVVAAGGDGTVCAVAAGLVDSPAALGVLPLGTLNHFAKDLRIPLDLPKAVAVVAKGHIAPIDAGLVNGRIFVNNSSIGIYPSIVDAREALRSQGHRKWAAMAIATVRVLRRYRGVKVTIEIDGRRHTWRTPFVFVGNNAYTIDGSGLGGRAKLDEGVLFVYLAPHLRVRDLPLLLLKALASRATQSGEFEIVRCRELWIDKPRTGRAQHVALDGEIRTMTTPLHYQARPGALRVVVPRS